MGKKEEMLEVSAEEIKQIKISLTDALEWLDSLNEIKASSGESEKSEESEIIVGSKVKWDDGEGEVIKIKGDTATVEDDNEDEHRVDLDDLELVVEKKFESEPKKKEAKIEVGSEVEWEDKDGDTKEGEVIKIKGDTATVEDDKGNEHRIDLDDLTLA